MRRRTWIGITAVVLVASTSAAGADVVRIALDWTPNTNHTGIFVAQDAGYFAEEGLEVVVMEPGPTVGLQLVAAGHAEFAVSMQEEVTMARSQGFPAVSIAALYPHNTSGFAAARDRGIQTPADFAGRRYGGWGSDLEDVMIRTVMATCGADADSVLRINMGTLDFATAVRRDVADFFWIFYGWDGIHAQLEGIDFVYIPLPDLAPELDYYTPVIVTSERLAAEAPSLVSRFLRALARGCVDAATHPDEAAEALLRHAPELDRALVVASQRWLASQGISDIDAWGRQDPIVWRRFAQWALEGGLIDEAIDPDAAFTNAFLPGGATSP
ncbi:MAG: ABC transporter substrate-binding protein [Candidatus Bipolaricaulota bacterium]|nr:ABC transporter substrate-binding protein [Candidatus Bipolaricaulota bacterium]